MERVLGETIAFSVASARPFEVTITNEDIPRADYLLMNVRTMYRNFWNAYDKQYRPNVMVGYKVFCEELISMAAMASKTGMKVSYYMPDYTDIVKSFAGAAPLKEKENPEHIRFAREEEIVMELLKQHKHIMIWQDKHLPPSPLLNSRVWMITSFPIDLLSSRLYGKLELLESHTGVLKQKADWLGKLTKNPDYMRLPFNLMTYLVFGDKLLVGGHSVKVRKDLMAIAVKCKWSQLTTIDTMRSDIRNSPVTDNKMLLYKLAMNSI